VRINSSFVLLQKCVFGSDRLRDEGVKFFDVVCLMEFLLVELPFDLLSMLGDRQNQHQLLSSFKFHLQVQLEVAFVLSQRYGIVQSTSDPWVRQGLVDGVSIGDATSQKFAHEALR